MPEHRKHPRRLLHPPVAFQTPEGPRVAATCHDISLGGMFIETPEPPSFGTKVRVYIELPGQATESTVEATVRWRKADGMGVQFGVMNARDTHALTTLLAARSESPAP